MKNILSNKIVKFLENNDVSFDVPGSYSIPGNIISNSIKEFIKFGKSDLIKKHKEWTWGCWRLDEIKKNGFYENYNLSLEDAIKLKKLKDFWKDNEDLEILNEFIRFETEREVIRNGYKFKRKKGFTNKLKNKCLKRDKNKCVKCKSTTILEVDHIKELIDGGNNLLNNLQTLCRKCHRRKTNKSYKERKNIRNERI